MQAISKTAADQAFELPSEQISNCASYVQDFYDYFNSPSIKFLVHSVSSCCTWTYGSNIDSSLVDGKLTVLSFFLHRLFVLQYAESSNQRNFFLQSLLVLRLMSNQISRIRVITKKPLQQEQNFFYMLFSFPPHVCF